MHVRFSGPGQRLMQFYLVLFVGQLMLHRSINELRMQRALSAPLLMQLKAAILQRSAADTTYGSGTVGDAP